MNPTEMKIFFRFGHEVSETAGCPFPAERGQGGVVWGMESTAMPNRCRNLILFWIAWGVFLFCASPVAAQMPYGVVAPLDLDFGSVEPDGGKVTRTVTVFNDGDGSMLTEVHACNLSGCFIDSVKTFDGTPIPSENNYRSLVDSGTTIVVTLAFDGKKPISATESLLVKWAPEDVAFIQEVLVNIGDTVDIVLSPVVSNVRASQRLDGSGLVDVWYDLAGAKPPITVSVLFSADNGVTWGVTPSAGFLTGDVGAGVSNGTNRHIVWIAGADKPGVHWTQTKAQVKAVDGGTGPQEVTVYLPGNVPLVLVHIPAGSFQMGSPDTERSRSFDEGPVHTVNIGDSFYMGKYEITQGQWKAVMGTNPVPPTSSYGVGDDYPVYYVSWNDCQAFVTALNAHIASTGQGAATFRLPSEAEWEYACRAGTQTRFFFGDSLGADDYPTDAPAGTLPGNRSDYMWFGFNNSPNGTKPVGTKLPNQFGLYDMSGNVWEWCQDYWHWVYTNAPSDGSAWESPTSSSRVLRGGGWDNSANRCRSAYRYGDTPDIRYAEIGVRFVRTQ